jgi:hypothetical protein
MSSAKSSKKSTVGKKRAKVEEEVEEVETLDRRGRSRLTMRPVKRNQPVKKPIPAPNRKLAGNSSSPVERKSNNDYPKFRVSKVCYL